MVLMIVVKDATQILEPRQHRKLRKKRPRKLVVMQIPTTLSELCTMAECQCLIEHSVEHSVVDFLQGVVSLVTGSTLYCDVWCSVIPYTCI